MDSKPHYAIVGIFVLVLSAGIVIFAYWLGKYGFAGEYDRYIVYTKDSVSGLSLNASVKYMGLDVGSVDKIYINPKNPKEIAIILKIKKGTPITKGMSAQLKYFGLTGLAYIELTGGKKNAPLLKPTANYMPVIKAKASIYEKLDTTLSDIMAKMSLTFSKINKLLTNKTIKNIDKTIENSEKITANIKNSNQDISKAIKNFVKIENNILALSKKISKTSLKVSSSVDAFKNMSNLITKSVQNGNYNLKNILSSPINQLNQSLRKLKLFLQAGEEAIEELKNSPSDLLFKKQKLNLGPGEK